MKDAMPCHACMQCDISWITIHQIFFLCEIGANTSYGAAKTGEYDIPPSDIPQFLQFQDNSKLVTKEKTQNIWVKHAFYGLRMFMFVQNKLLNRIELNVLTFNILAKISPTKMPLKDNKHNSLHLTSKICSDIFPWTLSSKLSFRTDNVCRQISVHIFLPNEGYGFYISHVMPCNQW